MSNTDFTTYYQNIFPDPEEHGRFIDGLSLDTDPILRFDPQNETQLKQLWKDSNLDWKPLSWYPYALTWPSQIDKGQPLPGYDQHLFYPMNASSLLPVLTLKPRSDDTVLDACAAPGGKALMIAQHFRNQHLTANDLSRDRSIRMSQVFKDHQAQVSITTQNAETIFFKQPKHYNKILIDAPCSSEKHVYNSPKHLDQWTPNRVKQLHKRQVSLISGLLQALKPEGELVYSTCAITPEENEAVVADILKRKKNVQLLDARENLPPNAPTNPGRTGEYKTEFDLNHVIRIYPNPGSDLDPMFVARFKKH